MQDGSNPAQETGKVPLKKMLSEVRSERRGVSQARCGGRVNQAEGAAETKAGKRERTWYRTSQKRSLGVEEAQSSEGEEWLKT